MKLGDQFAKKLGDAKFSQKLKDTITAFPDDRLTLQYLDFYNYDQCEFVNSLTKRRVGPDFCLDRYSSDEHDALIIFSEQAKRLVGVALFCADGLKVLATQENSFKGAGTLLYTAFCLLNKGNTVSFQVGQGTDAFYQKLGALPSDYDFNIYSQTVNDLALNKLLNLLSVYLLDKTSNNDNATYAGDDEKVCVSKVKNVSSALSAMFAYRDDQLLAKGSDETQVASVDSRHF